MRSDKNKGMDGTGQGADQSRKKSAQPGCKKYCRIIENRGSDIGQIRKIIAKKSNKYSRSESNGIPYRPVQMIKRKKNSKKFFLQSQFLFR